MPTPSSSMFAMHLTRMFRREEHVGGLVVTDDAIALTFLKPTGDPTKSGGVLFEHEVPLSPGTIRGGTLVNRAAFAEALRAFAGKKLPSRSVVLSLPPSVAQPFVFSFAPSLSSKEITTALELTVDSSLPLSRDAAYVDWEEIPGSELTKQRFLLAMGVKDLIDPYFAVLKDEGFVPIVCETHGWGVGRMLDLRTTPALVVQFTPAAILFYAYEQGVPVFHFSLPTDALRPSFEVASPVKENLPPPPVSPEPSLPPLSEPVSTTPARTPRAAKKPASKKRAPSKRRVSPRPVSMHEDAPAPHFEISADTTLDPAFSNAAIYTERILRFLRTDPEYGFSPSNIVVVGTSLQASSFSALLPSSLQTLLKPYSPSVPLVRALASAAALRGLLSRTSDTFSSLMPVGTQLAYERQRFLSFLQFVQKLTLALGGFFVLFFSITALFINSIFSTAVSSSLYTDPSSGEAQTLVREAATTFNASIERLTALLSGSPRWEPFFKEFDALMNEALTISRIEVNSTGSLTFSGTARDRNALLGLRDTLQSSAVFTPIDVPLSLLLANNQIPFTFTVQLRDPQLLH